MTRATLTDVLTPALAQGYAVAGVVCLGWEDARAYTRAAELEPQNPCSLDQNYNKFYFANKCRNHQRRDQIK